MIKIPCPVCCGDGFFSPGDRHVENRKEVCQRCKGAGEVDPETGQRPETSSGAGVDGGLYAARFGVVAHPTAPDTAPTDRGAGEVEVLRAMLVEMEAAASEMLNSLPGHWHDDATIRLTDAAEDARKALERPAGYSPSDDEPDALASPAPDPQAGSDSPVASGVDAEGRQAFERYPHLASAVERYGNHNSLENWGLMLGAINDTLATPPPSVPATRDAGLDREALRSEMVLAAHNGLDCSAVGWVGFLIDRLLDGPLLDRLAPTPGKAPGQDAVEAQLALLSKMIAALDELSAAAEAWSARGGDEAHRILPLIHPSFNAVYQAYKPLRTALAAIRATQADTGEAEAQRAIRFALAIDDHYNVRDFLDGWLKGDTSEWPEFAEGAERPRDEDEDDVPAPTLATDGEG